MDFACLDFLSEPVTVDIDVFEFCCKLTVFLCHSIDGLGIVTLN